MEKQLKEIIKALVDNKAEDVIYFDCSNVNPLAQYYIICSANSIRHASALANYAKEALEKNDIKINHIEGNEKSEWILVDANDYIVHIFTHTGREKYNLEKMWSNQKIYKVD